MLASNTLMNRIRELILSGELAPGERVTEAALATRLGMSRTPIRNVLPGLAAEGLIEPVGRRGFAVRAFSNQDCLQALELRSVLEGQAARMLVRKGASEALIAELNQCLDQGDAIFGKRYLDREDEREYGEMNGRFHDLIVGACNVPVLRTMVERLNNVPFVAPAVIVFDQVGLRRAFELLFLAHGQHHAIVEAIVMRDGERAENLFREHANQQRVSMFARRAEAEAGSGLSAL